MLELSPLLTATNAAADRCRTLQHVAVETDAGHPAAAESGAQPAEGLRVAIDDGHGVAVVFEDVARVERPGHIP